MLPEKFERLGLQLIADVKKHDGGDITIKFEDGEINTSKAEVENLLKEQVPDSAAQIANLGFLRKALNP